MESRFQADSLPSDLRAELVLSDLPVPLQPAQTFSEWFFFKHISFSGQLDLGRMAQIGLMSWVLFWLCIPPLLVISQIPMGGKSQTQIEKTCSDFFLGLGEVKVDTFLRLSFPYCRISATLTSCLKICEILRLETKQHILEMSVHIFRFPHLNVLVQGIAALHCFSWV